MSDFKTSLVVDATIGDITSDLGFAVKSGASSVTFQPFPSTSSSNSALIFTVQVPSENVVMGRDVLLRSGLQFTIDISGVPNTQCAFSYGYTDSLQAYPLAQLMTTLTAQINNTTTSINLQDCIDQLLRMNDGPDVNSKNGMTPSYPDQTFGYYSDGVGANCNVLASGNNQSYDDREKGRGAYPVTVVIARYVAGVYQDASPISTGAANETWKVFVSTVVSEPLFLSPFIFADPEHNCQGVLGLNNWTLNASIDTTLKRLMSTANDYTETISPGWTVADPSGLGRWVANPNLFACVFTNTYTDPVNGTYANMLTTTSFPTLLLKFLSTQPSQVVETKNVLPFSSYSRYLTPYANNAVIEAGAKNVQVTSSNIQINQIPDYIMIIARKPKSSQTIFDTSSFLAINGVSINFNNSSGLLSTASQQDLWRMSQRNGSNITWEEFLGSIYRNNNKTSGYTVPTTGGMLVINPAYDLSLPMYLTNGSLGNYNLQFQLFVSNQFGENIAPELVVICVNSGIMTIAQGTAQTYTGILTKDAVLAAQQGKEDFITSVMDKRMVGGNIHNMGVARPLMRRMREKVGSAMSGGFASGGGLSGGKGRLRGMY